MHQEHENSAMTIGGFTRRAGITEDTARYYERMGLLTPARGPNNYRVYGPGELQRMHFINTARASGFALGEIKAFIALFTQGKRSCADYEDLARRKLDDLDEKIRVLQEARDTLQASIENCVPVNDECRALPPD